MGVGEVVLRMAIHQFRLLRVQLVLLHGHHVDRLLGEAGRRLPQEGVADAVGAFDGDPQGVEVRQVEEAEEQVVEVVRVELRLLRLRLIALVYDDVHVHDDVFP